MEPLIKLNNKNNLFDCPIHKTKTELLNGNQQQQHNNSSQQSSVYYLSSHRSHQQQKQQARVENGVRRNSDAEKHQQTLRRTQLLIL